MQTIFDKRTGQTFAAVSVITKTYRASDIDSIGEYGTVDVINPDRTQTTERVFRNSRGWWFKIDGTYRAPTHMPVAR
jgi:hypothetical protein